MENTLNTELLSSMIKSKRGKKGLRDTAEEIGNISPATLSRIEQGNLPDIETFIQICQWLKTTTDKFITGPRQPNKAVTEKDMVVYQLRASRSLDKDTIDIMVKMVDMAFNNVRKNVNK
jgi:transcriptional regulator with XRE-family HTH domain